jgi:hypothetical protein
MPDESPRSAPSNPPDQRRGGGAPSWWTDLQREDLPDDTGPPPTTEPHGEHAVRRPRSRPRQAVHQRSVRERLRDPALVGVAVLLAAVIAWLGVGGGGGRSAVVALILFGVPCALAVIAAWLVVRRG